MMRYYLLQFFILRKFSSKEKMKLGTALTRLSPDNLTKVLEIVAQGNPSFDLSTEEVDLDIGAQVIMNNLDLPFFFILSFVEEKHKACLVLAFKLNIFGLLSYETLHIVTTRNGKK